MKGGVKMEEKRKELVKKVGWGLLVRALLLAMFFIMLFTSREDFPLVVLIFLMGLIYVVFLNTLGLLNLLYYLTFTDLPLSEIEKRIDMDARFIGFLGK
jgi:hypothetical protein